MTPTASPSIPSSGHIFVVDGDSAVLTVIDPKTDAAIATIDAGGGLEYAVAGDNGKLYVNGAEKKEIVRIDTATNTVDAHWPIPGCTSPHGLAIDTAGHRLFPTCLNAVMTVVEHRQRHGGGKPCPSARAPTAPLSIPSAS